MSMSQRTTVHDLTEDLVNLQINQANELRKLINKHWEQERALLNQILDATADSEFGDAVKSISATSDSVIKIPPPAEVITPEHIVPTPVATLVRTVPEAIDYDRRPLHVGDRVCLLTRGRNNNLGDPARVLSIHLERENWIKVRLEYNGITTHCLGTNLQIISHNPNDAGTS